MVNYAHFSKPRWTISESPLGGMYQLRKEGEEEKGWGQSSVLVPRLCRTLQLSSQMERALAPEPQMAVLSWSSRPG